MRRFVILILIGGALGLFASADSQSVKQSQRSAPAIANAPVITPVPAHRGTGASSTADPSSAPNKPASEQQNRLLSSDRSLDARFSPAQNELNELVRQRKELEGRNSDLKAIDGRIAEVVRRIQQERNPLDQGADVCPAVVISAIPYTDTGTTSGYGNDYSVSCAYSAAPDVVYQYTPSVTGSHTVSLCGSGFDTALEVRMSGACPGESVVGCVDDACGLQSELSLGLSAGITYYIIVDGYGGSAGPYVLNVTGPPPPGPDVCPGTVIYGLPFSDSQNTSGMANNFTPSCANSNAPDAVYTYMSPTTGSCTISLCGSGFDTILELRDGGACPGNSVVACNDDYCGTGSQITAMLVAGVTYYIIVDGYGSASGAYMLSVTGGTAAPGDNCGNPLTISSVPFSTSGTTAGAMNDYTPSCSYSAAPDIVYTFLPPANGSYTVSLCGSSFNTVLDLRVNGDCPGGSVMACNDNYCGTASQVTADLVAGMYYYVIIDGYSNEEGAYTLNVTGPPASGADVCPGTTITSVPFTDTQSTAGMANDYTPGCASSYAPDAIYTYTPAVSGMHTVSLCGSYFDTVIDVRSGGPCPGSYSVACNDDYCAYNASEVTASLQAGSTYYILVDGYASSAGTYTLNVTGPPPPQPGDNCSSPIVISAVPYLDTGNTVGMYNDFTPACQYSIAPDVVYQFTPQVTGNYVASLCGSSYNTILSIMSGDPCPGTGGLACNDDFCGLQSELNALLYAGVTYYIIVDGSSDEYGDYSLYVNLSPIGDRFSSAINHWGQFTATGNTCDFTHDYDAACNWSSISPDVVHRFSSEENRLVDISLCLSSYDTKLYVYRDNGTIPGELVICSDDAPACDCAPGPFRSVIEGLYLFAEEVYYIVVDGYGGACGDYTLIFDYLWEDCDITPQPGDITEAEENCSDPGFGANDPNGGPNSTPPQFGSLVSGQTVFGRLFSYREGGGVAMDTDWYLLPPMNNAGITLYSEAEGDIAVEVVDANTGGAVIISYASCIGGQFYQSSVSGANWALRIRSSDVGNLATAKDYRVSITIEQSPPANDDCANAIPLALNDPSPTIGTTAGATNDCPGASYPDVWYTFTLTECSEVTAHYCGLPEGISMHSYIYSGSCCGTIHYLTRSTSDTCDPLAVNLIWGGLPPGQYWLPVALSEETPFSIRLTAAAPPANDQCANAEMITSLPTVRRGATGCATVDAVTPCPSLPTAPGVWYRIIGTGNTMTATTCWAHTNFDTKLSVFRGDCSGMICVAGNDDDPACSYYSLASSLSWCSWLGEEYWILVHGYNDATGNYALAVSDDGISCAPPNDDCANAVTLVMNDPNPTCGTTIGATPDCLPVNTVWYTFTLSQPEYVAIEYCGSDRQNAYTTGLHRGVCCGEDRFSSITERWACADSNWVLHYGVLPAGQYWHPVSAPEPWLFCVRLRGANPPPNDNCADAVTLIPPAERWGFTASATPDPVPDCSAPASAPGIWYKVTGSGERLRATTCNTLGLPFDTRISIFACGCEAPTCVSDSDDDPACAGNPLASTVTWCAIAGEEYWILVHGSGTLSGQFLLSVEPVGIPCTTTPPCGPVNDVCDYALPLEVNAPSPTCGTTTGATRDCADTPIDMTEVWYTFTLDQCADMSLEYCGSSFLPVVTAWVYTATCCSIRQVYLDAEHALCPDGRLIVRWGGLQPGQYWVPVMAPEGTDFCIRATAAYGPPANDQCSAAAPLAFDQMTYGTTLCATVDAVPPCPVPVTAPGVWYTVTGNGDSLELGTCFNNSGHDFINYPARFSIFTCGCSGLVWMADYTEILCGGSGDQMYVFRWCSAPGEQYWILVHGADGEAGNFIMRVSDMGTSCSGVVCCPDDLPSQVTGVFATDNRCNDVIVTWSDIANETGYSVLRDGGVFAMVEADVTACMDFPGPGTYSYSVIATNACGNSPISDSASGTRLNTVTSPVILSSPPSGATVQSGTLQQYCWQAVGAASWYQIQWDDDLQFGSPLFIDVNGLCIDQALTDPLGIWYWRVSGANGCGLGPWSEARAVQLIDSTLETPVLVIRMSAGELRLTWAPVSGATSYLVEYADNPVGPFQQLVVTSDTSITQPPDIALRRFYRVVAQAGSMTN